MNLQVEQAAPGSPQAPKAPALPVRQQPKSAPSPPVCSARPLTPDEQNVLAILEPFGLDVTFPKDPALMSRFPSGSPVRGPNDVPRWKMCTDGLGGLIWIPKPAAPVPPKPITDRRQLPRFVVQTLENRIQVPQISVGLNPPSALGITGLESYFWLGGYDGTPVAKTTSNPSYRIDIRATPSSYVWGFGDGTGMTTTSAGLAYPQVSPIRHLYETRSDWSPLAVNGMYHVTVTVQFNSEFRLIGPGFSPDWVNFASLGFAPLKASAAQDYKVGEVRSALTGSSTPR